MIFEKFCNYFKNILIAINIKNTAKARFNIGTGNILAALAPNFEVKTDVIVMPNKAGK